MQAMRLRKLYKPKSSGHHISLLDKKSKIMKHDGIYLRELGVHHVLSEDV